MCPFYFWVQSSLKLLEFKKIPAGMGELWGKSAPVTFGGQRWVLRKKGT